MKGSRWFYVVLVVVLALAWWLWPARHTATATHEDPSLVVGRAWLDKAPKGPRDVINVLLFAPDAPLGLVHQGSAYDFRTQLFDWRRERDTLDLMMLQSEKRMKLRVHVDACSDQPPFDLCLTLSANPWGGPKKLYGMRNQRRSLELAGVVGAALDDVTSRTLPPAAARP
jgi:hypothetical protein